MDRRPAAAGIALIAALIGVALLGPAAALPEKAIPKGWCRPGHPHYDPAACGATTTAPSTSTSTTIPPTTTTLIPTTTTTVAPTTTAAPTTTLPPTTTTAAPSACVGFQVPAPSNLNTVLASRPAGTTFCLAAGQHNVTGSGAVLENGDRIVGALSAAGARLSVVDGGDTASKAFLCNCSGGALINIIIEDVANGYQQSSVGHALENWLFDNIEVRFNAGTGLHTHNGSTVRNSYIHHNAQMGVGGQGDFALWENNEIAFNNPDQLFAPNDEAGGSKWVNTVGLVVRGNHFHDNCGHALWLDGTGNHGALIEDNLVADNAGNGIFYELTGSGTVIRNNRVERSNTRVASLPNCPFVGGIFGIYLSDARDADVYGNILVDNGGGIGAQQSERQTTRNLSVHDNDITLTRGWSGFRCNADPCVADPNIDFEANDYHVPTVTGTWWGWRPLLTGTLLKTWDQWRALGFDDTGTAD